MESSRLIAAGHVALGLLAIVAFVAGPTAAAAVPPLPSPALTRPGGALYKPAYRYPVIEKIEARRDSLRALADSEGARVDARHAAEARRRRDEAVTLRVDWRGIERPASPEAFPSAFHFPPVPQYDTGTCWAFCSTSFFESEAARLSGRRVKLSEMWTVYWEYVEKARRFVRERGQSPVVEGSQDHGTQEVYRLYGAVPLEAYRGVRDPDGWYDHPPLRDEIAGCLRGMQESGVWDEAAAIASVRLILDRHMGPPPETFAYEGRTYTPVAFLADVLRLSLDDYVHCVSTLREPFHTRVLLDVPDNWRRRDDYLNLPLDQFYRVIREAVQAGGTVSIGGDVSEPGMDGLEGAAVIPAWDIPAKLIAQDSRELRIVNGTTGDDHGVHLIGFLRQGGRDWFLVKDSNQSSRLGRFKGYYFYDGDYIRLKMLSFMVHKDRLAGLLP
jgi:bleomycin hydrolase